jgi:hypothetical protein
VEDFFDDPTTGPNPDLNYPRPLFTCSDVQARYVTKKNIKREIIFDGVKRSNTTCGYDTHIREEKKTTQTTIQSPGPRQQLKHCKVKEL